MNYQNRSGEYSSNSFISVQNLLCISFNSFSYFKVDEMRCGFLQSAGQEKDEILQKVIDHRRVGMAEGELRRTVEIC